MQTSSFITVPTSTSFYKTFHFYLLYAYHINRSIQMNEQETPTLKVNSEIGEVDVFNPQLRRLKDW